MEKRDLAKMMGIPFVEHKGDSPKFNPSNPHNHPHLKGFRAKKGTLEEKLAYMKKSKEKDVFERNKKKATSTPMHSWLSQFEK